MRFSFVVLTVFGAVASVSALSLLARQSSFPPCTAPCFANANLGGCQPTDNLCLCTNTEFIQTTTACFESACTGDDLTAAESAAQAICASVGVTLGPTSATSTDPVTTSTDPATTSTDPATTSTDPATANTDPATTDTDPATTNTDPATTTITVNTDPATTNTDPVTTTTTVDTDSSSD